MANKIELKLTGGWKKMANALDSEAFRKNLEDKMGKATQVNGMMVRGEIRKRIKGKRYQRNNPMTVLIKKSSTPLVDDGDLFGSITSQTVDAYSVFVGVLRTATDSDGKPLVNLVQLLHEGGTIQVTAKMRAMFEMLWEVGQGKRDPATLEGGAADLAAQLGDRIKSIRPLKPTTTALHIPPRRFITEAFDDPRTHKRAKAIWEKALKEVFRNQAAGKKSTGKAGDPAKEAARSGRQRKVKVSKPPRNRSEAARKGWQNRRAKEQKK